MNETRTRFPSSWCGALALAVAAGCSPGSTRGQENRGSVEGLTLDYEAFDQRPSAGWRQLADGGKPLEAARLIDRYEERGTALKHWQRVNLRFHAGQLYAFAGRKDPAIARFRASLTHDEPADSPIRWNAYVRATIAFLDGDLRGLTVRRGEIAEGPKLDGIVPNLDVVDRLIAHFGEPYSVAYRSGLRDGD